MVDSSVKENALIVISHKDFSPPNDPLYRPLIVGRDEKFANRPGFFYDFTGDSISEKNPFYCELTGLYWFWKNENSKYKNVGLVHYRRYFTKALFSRNPKHFLNSEDIEDLLSDCDVILPHKFRFSVSVEQFYEIGKGLKKDLRLTREILKQDYPQYLDAYDEVLSSKSASYCNMFVMSSQNVDAYCTWLFDILGKLEDKIDLNEYKDGEERVFGYLGEILLNVWIKQGSFKIKYLHMIHTESSFLSHLRHIYLYLRSLANR